jgi:hypothetical protein
MAVLTVYPESGNPAAAACDGTIGNNNVTYATGQAAATGSEINSTNINTLNASNEFVTGVFYFCRAVLNFDTSALPSDAVISGAVLSLYSGAAKSGTDADSISIVANTVVSNVAYAVEDYDLFGTTKLATDISIASWSTSNWNDFTLNAAGLAAITKAGITKFGVRTAKDITATQPSGANSVNFVAADAGGNIPKMVITYTVPSSGFFAFF